MMNDGDLIRRILKGDERAFEELIIQYGNLIHHIIFSLVRDRSISDDLFQEIIIKVYKRLPSFQNRSRLSTWIGKIAYNHCINYLRKERIRPHFLEISEAQNIAFTYNTTNRDDEERLSEIIARAIDQLPEHYGLILRLFHMDNLTYNEIAQILQISEGTIKSRLFRARKILKSILTELR